MIKALGAFFLGVLSIPLAFVVGEPLGVFALCIAMAAYFFICQFWLSRGNPHAFLKDWPIMILLNAVFFLFQFICFFLPDNRNVTYALLGFAILLACFAGTLAGAFVASRAAHRKARRK
jgi:hypothetical protein